AAGRVLGRRGQGYGGPARGHPADPRRRRPRLDHRPQLVPASAPAGARAAGPGGQDLPRPSVSGEPEGPWIDPEEARTGLLLLAADRVTQRWLRARRAPTM